LRSHPAKQVGLFAQEPPELIPVELRDAIVLGLRIVVALVNVGFPLIGYLQPVENSDRPKHWVVGKEAGQ